MAIVMISDQVPKLIGDQVNRPSNVHEKNENIVLVAKSPTTSSSHL